jgi:hypothetical protein
MARMAARLNQLMAEQVTLRSQAEVERFFRGLRLVPPGMSGYPSGAPTRPRRQPGWAPYGAASARSDPPSLCTNLWTDGGQTR